MPSTTRSCSVADLAQAGRVKLSEIVEAIGCSKASATDIRRGKRSPHGVDVAGAGGARSGWCGFTGGATQPVSRGGLSSRPSWALVPTLSAAYGGPRV